MPDGDFTQWGGSAPNRSDEVIESIQAIQKAGIQQVAIQAVTDPEETIETFAKEIIKRWK